MEITAGRMKNRLMDSVGEGEGGKIWEINNICWGVVSNFTKLVSQGALS